MTVEQRIVKVLESLEKIATEAKEPTIAISALNSMYPFLETLLRLPPTPKTSVEVHQEINAAPTAEEKKPAEKPKEAKKPTKDDIGAAVRAAVATHGADKVKAFITSTYGVDRASATPEDKWAEVITAIKGIK